VTKEDSENLTTEKKDYSSLRFDLILDKKPDEQAAPEVEDELKPEIVSGPLDKEVPEINFVLVERAQAAPISYDVQETPSVTESAPPSRSILVAEDNPVNQRNIKELLEKESYHVELANNGKEALQKLQENIYHAMILDCEMPVLSGYEVIKTLRSEEMKTKTSGNPKKLPVIALAVHLSAEDKAHLKTLGINASMTKPVRKTELLHLLKGLI